MEQEHALKLHMNTCIYVIINIIVYICFQFIMQYFENYILFIYALLFYC